MKERSIFELANDPRFIPGIYNYCDRWCERCHLRSKCLVYSLEQDEMEKLADYELADEAYWRKLLSTLDKIIAKLRTDFKNAGLEFNDRVANRAVREAKQRHEKHPLMRAAQHYASLVKSWMSQAKSHFKPKIEELHKKLDLGLDEDGITDESDRIVEALDTIIWYQHEIRAKILRALAQREMELVATVDNQRDSDGSAKVALLCIEASIAAWNTLCEHLPEKTDDMLTFLASLQRLRKETEKRFPEAWHFKRPGFDD